MDSPKTLRNRKLGEKVVQAFRNRYFDAWYFEDIPEAVEHIVSLIPKDHSVGWGGSQTLNEIGIKDRLAQDGYKLLDRDKTANQEEREKVMRQVLLCDTMLTGSNAISEDGQLVNIDGAGNRVAAMIYGPGQVIVVAGMNKVAKTLDDAVTRARTIAAPLNVQRFPDTQTPCYKTGSCVDCVCPTTVCNIFVRIKTCRPAGRIKVVLIGKDLGL